MGEEAQLAHDTRLLTGLGKLKIRTWPFDGPAYLREGNEMLLVENWAYLGSAQSEEEMWAVLDGESAQFDKDTYKILSKLAGKLQSLTRIDKN